MDAEYHLELMEVADSDVKRVTELAEAWIAQGKLEDFEHVEKALKAVLQQDGQSPDNLKVLAALERVHHRKVELEGGADARGASG